MAAKISPGASLVVVWALLVSVVPLGRPVVAGEVDRASPPALVRPATWDPTVTQPGDAPPSPATEVEPVALEPPVTITVTLSTAVHALTTTLDFRQFLPVVIREEPPPQPPPTDTIRVYDADGAERDLAWLRARYGDFVIRSAAEGDGPVYRITKLREQIGSDTLLVGVVDADGAAVAGIQVAFYWQDADLDDGCGPAGGVPDGMVPNRCVHTPTNAGGVVGFGMGDGAYYRPDLGQIGPHAVWVYGATTRSDLILGLGRVAAANDGHFDVTFSLDEGEPPPPPPPPPPAPVKVYDAAGVERDLAWLRSKYGSFIIQPAASGTGPVYKITALRERVSTYAAIVVKVGDASGTPLPGIQTAFYWSDANADADCGPAGGVYSGMVPNRCIHEATKDDGAIGFGMGTGAYYWPDKGEIGPHAAWIYGAATRSDLILGLGMVAATNHDHFDVDFTRYASDPIPADEIGSEAQWWAPNRVHLGREAEP